MKITEIRYDLKKHSLKYRILQAQKLKLKLKLNLYLSNIHSLLTTYFGIEVSKYK
jgi:hypothetical protein